MKPEILHDLLHQTRPKLPIATMHWEDTHASTTPNQQMATMARLERAPFPGEPALELVAGQIVMIQQKCSECNITVRLRRDGPSRWDEAIS